MHKKKPQDRHEKGKEELHKNKTCSSSEEKEPIKEQNDSKLKELETEISSLKDLYLRKQAEFENYRKRTLKEKEELIIYANKQLMEEFISLIDNFERALKVGEQTKDFEQFYSGINMIRESFVANMANKYHLESFGEAGEVFDPEKHEAISLESDPQVDTPSIKEVFQKGYSLQGRIIRTAKVKVVQA